MYSFSLFTVPAWVGLQRVVGKSLCGCPSLSCVVLYLASLCAGQVLVSGGLASEM